MNIPISFLPRTPFRRRKRHSPVIGAPGLSIVSVLSIGSEVVVQFSDSITWDGSTVPGNFQAFTADENWQSPINVMETGASYVKLEFNADVAAGAGWQLIGAMEGITGAGGADIAWPQSGIVS